MFRSLLCPFAVVAIGAGLNTASAQGAGSLRGKPEEVGLSSTRLQRIDTLMKAHMATREIAGAVTLVARRGKIVHLAAHGRMDHETERPLRTDAQFRLASMTKPITAVAVLILMEEGKLLLSDPVAKYLPEFRDQKVAVFQMPNDPRGAGMRLVPAERPVTIQHLLTHTGGFPADSNGPAGDATRRAGLSLGLTLAEYTRRTAALPLRFQPGTQWEYAGQTGFAVLGRIIEVVSGMNAEQFFQRRIFAPLGMRHTSFAVPDAQVVPTYLYANGKPTIIPPPDRPANHADFYSASGGLVGTIDDYFVFAQMLLNGGQFNGVRVLSRKSVELMSDNAIGDLTLGNYPVEGHDLKGYGFGLSVRVRTSTGRSGWLGSPGDYGWAGATGPYFWIDPKEQLIGIYMMATRIGRIRTEFPNLVYGAFID